MAEVPKFPVRRNIRLAYTFVFFWMFIPVIPIFIPYLSGLGFNMKEIFLLQAYFGLVVTVFEVPSGYVADIFGRVFSLKLGALFAALGFTYLYFAEHMWQLILYETLVGIGLSMVSGADFSLLYDSLKSARIHQKKTYTRTVSRYLFILLFAEAVSSVVAGVATLYSISSVIWLTAVFSWIPFLICFGLVEPDTERLSRDSHLDNFKKVLHFIFVERHFVRLLFTNMTIWALSTFCAVWIIQKVWMDENLSLFWFGMIWAAFQLTAGLTGNWTPKLKGRFGAKTLVFSVGAMVVLGYLGLAFLDGVAVILVGVLFYFARGINSVIFKDAINRIVPSEFRATANSMQSFLFRGSFIFIGPIIGASLDRYGNQPTLIGLALAFFLLILVAMLPLLSQWGQQKAANA